MAKSANQKVKLLYLMSILLDKTDPEHGITMQEILNQLELYGITAERKSIYDDLEALRYYGIDIAYIKGKAGAYKIMNREFELPELKLLVDAVQSCKFITHKRSEELIKKLERLSSEHVASQLQRQVYVAERVKTPNKSVYYNVDMIHEAISENVMIEFTYLEWSLDKKLQPKKDGTPYVVSPWALVWVDENYYMVAYDDAEKKIKHYRVDKMKDTALLAEKRKGKESFKTLDMAKYSKSHFGMFGGKEEKVKLRFANHLIGVVLDRFGTDIPIEKQGEDSFVTRVDVTLSPQFYAWLFGFGAEACILSPKEAVQGMEKQLSDATKAIKG